MAEKETRSALIIYRGTPLAVEYTTTGPGDIDISVVCIRGEEIMELLADDVLAQIRDAVKRKEET